MCNIPERFRPCVIQRSGASASDCANPTGPQSEKKDGTTVAECEEQESVVRYMCMCLHVYTHIHSRTQELKAYPANYSCTEQ